MYSYNKFKAQEIYLINNICDLLTMVLAVSRLNNEKEFV